MPKQLQFYLKPFLLISGISLIMIPLLIYIGLLLRRPPRTNLEKQLSEGINYQREARYQPRPILLHIVSIDLNSPGVKLFVTPGDSNNQEMDIKARTTSEFLQEYNLQLAINGSFFHPFVVHHPWNYYPRSGDFVKVNGQAISEGKIYSEASAGWYVFCVSKDNQATIGGTKCPKNTQQAFAGSAILVKDGQVVENPDNNPIANQPVPRTAVAIDKTGKKLWLIIVDGRQPFYSDGVTLTELAEIITDLGADRGLNLDGGGSTTLVIDNEEKTQVLNAPFHTRIPMRQRPIANHLGVYFQAD
ncbi:phosphodiester glycosidase family protein [Oscillatoria salina]|uniref:phosphodiester glycosidase family protein n=1 Tax=Oscillatoria salina TaxID=331517 RepID=UPI001CD02DAE|nr:phosphodiester glycosidase family protein [Oscillatoria salina]MBZ8178684.1 phosphodiester glycosidase family protein [Oscillatoria salina IIICB1]